MAYVLPGSNFTGKTQVRLFASYFGLPSTLGNVSSASCTHDQLPSAISLLNVTWIDLRSASTSLAPDCGTVFTTTGGAVATVTSSALRADVPNTSAEQAHSPTNRFIHFSWSRGRRPDLKMGIGSDSTRCACPHFEIACTADHTTLDGTSNWNTASDFTGGGV